MESFINKRVMKYRNKRITRFRQPADPRDLHLGRIMMALVWIN